MKTTKRSREPGAFPRRGERAALMVELTVALGILGLALTPLSLSFYREQRMARAFVQRAVALEIVDGETEVLQAGAWRAYGEGTRAYEVNADAAASLPPGRFELTITNRHLRLAWIPSERGQGGAVVREVALP
ncbi:MAG: hypothetical protein H7A45_14970 [Verrucomicrobiales bacterium]|nr:hypothetical protein [Verrucomicrobiales bacterium]MCP5526136.1 hypothetical protein [Verrucomicrobiales bacterium]